MSREVTRSALCSKRISLLCSSVQKWEEGFWLGGSCGNPLETEVVTAWNSSEVKLLSRVQFFATPWMVAHQALRSMGFSRQEYWSGLPCPSSGDLSDPGIEPESSASPALQAGSLLISHQGRNLCQFCLNHPIAHHLYDTA